ncbi:DUF262 domain-containing protein [Clostridium sp. LY3-2]|uniref:DUF262 domain-containing protein n=1 Tax=Clostridium sp. LY3-2 TaxID=2942482 RepID=UPI0021530098|nr:DUF262 domain-containing protein [Clostridium sp. LY3-2]MCR6514271.1 DUF262 domain-containing protein [Clostridium sp. LY3-2]
MNIEETRESLLKLLGEKGAEFSIPLNQRKYSWEMEQLDDYYEDLKRIVDNQKEHYMGVITMIETKEGKKTNYKVVDGQQRIITSIIFLCALRDLSIYYYKKFSNEKFIQFSIELQMEYLSLRSNDVWLIKIAPCKYDRDLLLDIVDVLSNKENYSATLKDEYIDDVNYVRNKLNVEKEECMYFNQNIVIAYNKFYGEIKKQLEAVEGYDEAVIKNLKDWRDAMGEVKIFELTSKNESNLFDYFESLNTKGLKLSQIDLVRNKLIKVLVTKGKEKEFIENISDIWDNIIDNTDEYDPVRFLKYFYMCEKKEVIKHSDIPELYEKLFEEQIIEIKALIDKMEVYSRIYYYLYNEGLYEGYDNEHYYLKYLGQEACYSFLMHVIYIYENKDEEFCKSIFELTEKVIFSRMLRRQSVKGIDELFKNFIKKSEEYSKEKLIVYINKEVDKIENIEQVVKERKWKNEKLLRYILMKYNKISFDKDNFIKGNIKVKKMSKEEKFKYNIGNFVLKGNEEKISIESREEEYIEFIKEVLKSNKIEIEYIN